MLFHFSDAYFGQGTGPIHIDNVGCSGSESVLVQCNHLTINNCVHAEDAGVRCSPPGKMTIVLDPSLRVALGLSIAVTSSVLRLQGT